jgi:hypothetical protein
MAVYYIGTYDIVDPEQFKKYPPLVMALLPARSWRQTPRPSWSRGPRGR